MQIDGMECTPQNFEALDMGEYRTRFPDETVKLTDQQVWDVVASSDDDHDDDEWRKLFAAASA